MTSPVERQHLEAFRSGIAHRLGLWFEDGKLEQLAHLVHQRMDALGLTHPQGYLERLDASKGSTEWRALVEPLTVGETYFFRNPDHFRALVEVILPERIRLRSRERRLRLLSAGCSSGEEPYTLALLVREHLPELSSWDIEIAALDLNPASLARAVAGRYSPWALRGTSPDVMDRWFSRDGKDYVLDASIRKMVTFEERNLALDDGLFWRSRGCDAVFCRNVIMYFTPEMMRAVVERLHQALLPGGYLFLGHAETLRGLSQSFHLRHSHDTFYYQRKDAAVPLAPTDGGDLAPSVPERPAAPTPDLNWAATWVETIQQASTRIEALSQQTMPSSSDISQAPARPDLTVALQLLQAERFGEALQLLAKLPAESAASPDTLLLRAVLLIHLGRPTEAEGVCAELLSRDELSAGAHYVLALCREAAGDLRGAGEQDQSALYLDPSFAMARLHLGLMARRQGDRAGVERELGQAILLLQREDTSRLLLFGGGFGRDALITLCRAELTSGVRR